MTLHPEVDEERETSWATVPALEGCSVTVVIPTRNEAPNIEPLVTRLGSALAGTFPRWEAVFVDDSEDATPQVVRGLHELGFPLRLVHREPGARPGGLGGAVVAGFGVASGEVIVVMDADLQHPPEVVPDLVAPVLAGEAALVAGSRYVWGGGAAGLDGPWRHLVSRSCRALVHVLLPPSRALQDPMSGFFALRRSFVDGAVLRPEGYKILLEVAVRARPDRVSNVGFTFAPRHAGSSKATLRQGLVFFKHLSRLVTAGHSEAATEGAEGKPVRR
ncbi:MAG TPA: glycosyltransferase [Acidimicrobiales bacterium]|nr:glycosyltransferase [Acidimicrobiales bacterium]